VQVDKELGTTGFAHNKSWKLYVVGIFAHTVAFCLKPVWWWRGY